MTDDIYNIRKDYRLQNLSESDVNNDPILQFKKWWNEALESNIEEPNAMTLATCSSTGKPSARIVLLKGIKEDGFLFFTNYDSRKGKQIESNGFVSLVFFWKELERQVRVEGEVKKTNTQESDSYFFNRPRISQIGAWSSPQSEVIRNREVLEKNVIDYKPKI